MNVAENGDIASADRVLVADGGAYPRAAQVNEDYVVVAYQQLFERNSGAQAAWDWDTAVSTVTYEGIPVGEPSLLSATTASETYPSVAYNPEDGVAVVAYEYYEGDGDDRDIDIAVLNVNNLGVLGTPVASNVFDSPTFDGWTDLAWDGVNGAFLLTWQHDFVDTTAQTVDGDIYALELDALGNPVGGAQGAIETEAEVVDQLPGNQPAMLRTVDRDRDIGLPPRQGERARHRHQLHRDVRVGFAEFAEPRGQKGDAEPVRRANPDRSGNGDIGVGYLGLRSQHLRFHAFGI